LKVRGWLLDAYVKEKWVNYWFKTTTGETVALRERCRPSLVTEPADSNKPEDLVYLFEEHPFVYQAKIVDRYSTLSREMLKRVVEVTMDLVEDLDEVQRYAENLPEVKEVYNVGLVPIQWHLIRKGFPPSRLCEVEVRRGVLEGVKMLDDSDEVEPPPFKPLIIVTPEGNKVDELRLLDEEQAEIALLGGHEEEVLQEFNDLIEEIDPDVLVTYSPTRTVKRLTRRARRRRVDLHLGRGGELYHGRVIIGISPYMDSGIAGLSERARFTFAPMGISADWEAGKTIDSRQCYEAMRLGVLVPKMKGGFSSGNTAWELVKRDRGGLLFSPLVGIHENVAALDFESMFPNIIVQRNVSYETVDEEGVRQDLPGFMGCFTGEFLKRRLYFKHLREKFAPGSKEWWWCQQRQSALKLMLVVVYGYSGCYANRFANVRVFQEINRQARKAMVQALNISLAEGYQIVYGDTDSLFIKRPDAAERDYKDLAAEISEQVGLPMGLDRHFRYLVLLNRVADNAMVASRRYYGALAGGGLFYRGIEMRRHDSPPYVKSMQTRIMETLFDAEDLNDVTRRTLPEALKVANRAVRNVAFGRVRAEDLIISKRLRRDVYEYQSLQPHIVAAMLGESFVEDESNYVLVNTEARNPFTRVMPAHMLSTGRPVYDKRKYAELTRRAAWNLLRPFVPDETTIGGPPLRESRLDTYF
jgi:DNA polymerase elongation subunit (family B)